MNFLPTEVSVCTKWIFQFGFSSIEEKDEEKICLDRKCWYIEKKIGDPNSDEKFAELLKFQPLASNQNEIKSYSSSDVIK